MEMGFMILSALCQKITECIETIFIYLLIYLVTYKTLYNMNKSC